MTKAKIVDPKVADAAFSLPDGGVSGIVEGRFGPVIVRVSNIVPDVVKTFAEVKDQLKMEIATKQAAKEVIDLHKQDRGRSRRRRDAQGRSRRNTG